MHVYAHLFEGLDAGQLGQFQQACLPGQVRDVFGNCRTLPERIQVPCLPGQVRDVFGNCRTLPGKIQVPCPTGQMRNAAGQCVTLPGRLPTPQQYFFTVIWTVQADCGDGRRVSRIATYSRGTFRYFSQEQARVRAQQILLGETKSANGCIPTEAADSEILKTQPNFYDFGEHGTYFGFYSPPRCLTVYTLEMLVRDNSGGSFRVPATCSA